MFNYRNFPFLGATSVIPFQFPTSSIVNQRPTGALCNEATAGETINIGSNVPVSNQNNGDQLTITKQFSNTVSIQNSQPSELAAASNPYNTGTITVNRVVNEDISNNLASTAKTIYITSKAPESVPISYQNGSEQLTNNQQFPITVTWRNFQPFESADVIYNPGTIIVNREANGAISNEVTTGETINIGNSVSRNDSILYQNNSDRTRAMNNCSNWALNNNNNGVVTNESQQTTSNVVNVGGQIVNNYF